MDDSTFDRRERTAQSFQATLIPIIRTYRLIVAGLIVVLSVGIDTLGVREAPQHERRLRDKAHAVSAEFFQICGPEIQTVEDAEEWALVEVEANFINHVEAVGYEVLPWGGNTIDVRKFSGAELCHRTVCELQWERHRTGGRASGAAPAGTIARVMVQVGQTPWESATFIVEGPPFARTLHHARRADLHEEIKGAEIRQLVQSQLRSTRLRQLMVVPEAVLIRHAQKRVSTKSKIPVEALSKISFSFFLAIWPNPSHCFEVRSPAQHTMSDAWETHPGRVGADPNHLMSGKQWFDQLPLDRIEGRAFEERSIFC